jgi:two-component system NtrC family response regulator
VLQYRQEVTQRKRIPAVLKREGIIGESTAVKQCLDLLAQAAASDANVLITGETGTGKELFARAVHANSPRSGANFVVVDCTVLPERLVESALFGHMRGAFTGADKTQKGLIAQADKGTLFLDEIGELPTDVQKVFLRVLQEHRFRQVGGVSEMISDFRLVAATNRNLDRIADQCGFRRDLFYRISGLTIDLPPLRERREDIKAIAIHHMSRFCERNRIGTKGFLPEFMDTLVHYDWPGNVRELVNAIESALTAARQEQSLGPIHLPTPIRVQQARRKVKFVLQDGDRPAADTVSALDFPTFRENMGRHEQDYIRELMIVAKGDMAAACRLSGLSRSRLYDLVKMHGGR